VLKDLDDGIIGAINQFEAKHNVHLQYALLHI
jgi:hypothetical protein